MMKQGFNSNYREESCVPEFQHYPLCLFQTYNVKHKLNVLCHF